jgi:pyrimidine operon attenuation protein/uracil phosphoribosyltransferase
MTKLSTSPSAPPEGAGAVSEKRSPDRDGRVVLDADGIRRATTRIAHEVLERGDPAPLCIIAILEGGVLVAQLIAEQIERLRGEPVERGELDVTLYRDDVVGRGKRPVPRRTRMPGSVARKRVVLVDEVVFTGRTIRAAMDAVIDFGRPASIQVAALIDRGHRELPIQVDYVGKNIPTSHDEEVVLRRGRSGQHEVVVL